MRTDTLHESNISNAHNEPTNDTAAPRPVKDDRPTECGLTREELRILVAEMIG
ncbi:MAG: hypothetical protein JWN07_1938 [Hyphomicrobiales bacterium]|nr:hypothetical protein [Hyphomicrobiales bacterium]